MGPDWSPLLRPAVRQVLDALIQGPRSLTELSAATGLSKPGLSRHLATLTELGVVARRDRRAGTVREVEYSLQPATLHLELIPDDALALGWGAAGQVPKRFPLAGQVPDAAARVEVETLLDGLRAARSKGASIFVVLFGSVARGESTWKSDVDALFVLPDDAPPSLRESLEEDVADVQARVQHAVRPIFTTRSAFLAGARVVEQEAAREGIIVFGPREVSDVWRRMERYRTISI